ncbi:class C sortase [Leucobacter tardus]|uniref:Class C sortase n=1 Tax=Leucobacter tardus TaxID=501483 RepID=A0A939TM77_9MICO|nr:class C sortase [Leucobacter tardus]
MAEGHHRAGGRRHRAVPRRWRAPIAPLIIACVALAGLTIWTYPSIASWFSQLDQARVLENADEYRDHDAAELRASDREQIERAHAYNDALQSGARIEANERLPLGGGEIDDDALAYRSVLDDGATGLMTRVRIPKIDVDLPTFHGTDDATLLEGLGHLEGTSLPVGGDGTHAVITGHRGLADARMFTDLDRIDVGDTFTLTTFGEVLAYEVIETTVVEPDETESLQAREGRDLVTLVTCTPLGVNSQRILVTAERVFPTPDADREVGLAAPEVPRFPWWAVILGGGIVVAGVYVWRSGLAPRATAPTPAPAASTEPPASTV